MRTGGRWLINFPSRRAFYCDERLTTQDDLSTEVEPSNLISRTVQVGVDVAVPSVEGDNVFPLHKIAKMTPVKGRAQG